MEIGNDAVSPTAREALRRIRALRTLTRQTGFQTMAEQSKVLLNLSTEDMLTVSALLAKDGGAR